MRTYVIDPQAGAMPPERALRELGRQVAAHGADREELAAAGRLHPVAARLARIKDRIEGLLGTPENAQVWWQTDCRHGQDEHGQFVLAAPMWELNTALTWLSWAVGIEVEGEPASPGWEGHLNLSLRVGPMFVALSRTTPKETWEDRP